MSRLLVISGHPASGKTTLAHRLAKDLGHWPIVSRDTIKEHLFNTLGWDDRAWSQKLGRASWELWPWAIELLMKTHQPLIAESNFSGPRAGENLVRLAEQYGYTCLEIHCVASPEVLEQRFRDRVVTGLRHPGHQDNHNLDEFVQLFKHPGVLAGVSPDPIILSTVSLTEDVYEAVRTRIQGIS